MAKVIRVIAVPMGVIQGEPWNIMREAASDAAEFANQCLAEWWAKRKYGITPNQSCFRDFGDRLSSYAREAVNDQIKGITKRLGRLILNNDIQLPTFKRERALTLRADSGHRGAKVSQNGAMISLQPRPAPAPWIDLPVWEGALKRDWYLRSTLEAIAHAEYKLTRAGCRFRSSKLFVHLTYSKAVSDTATGERFATLRYNETGELWLSIDGRKLNLTEYAYRLAYKKIELGAIQSGLYTSRKDSILPDQWNLPPERCGCTSLLLSVWLAPCFSCLGLGTRRLECTSSSSLSWGFVCP